MIKEIALSTALLSTPLAVCYAKGINGFDNLIDRAVQDDLLGQFSREIVIQKLSETNRCEFEFNMNGVAYRMEGVLKEQAPLLRLQETGHDKTFVLSLGDRKMLIEENDRTRRTQDLGYDRSPEKATIDKAFRKSLWKFDECEPIPEPAKPKPDDIIHVVTFARP